jgi:hypothetical protein
MMGLVRQVMKQTPARIFRGNTRREVKIISLFEPATEIIRKGKASNRVHQENTTAGGRNPAPPQRNEAVRRSNVKVVRKTTASPEKWAADIPG